MKFLIRLVVMLCFLSVANQSQAQKKVEVVTFDWYKALRATSNDTTYIVNFWATWCMPCVQELPEFEKMYQRYQGQAVKIILVSLDFYKKLQITVIPYLEKQKIQSEVVLLNEPDYNSWIDKVNKKWSGSIPATIIFNNKKKYNHFIEGETTFDEIDQLLKNIKP